MRALQDEVRNAGIVRYFELHHKEECPVSLRRQKASSSRRCLYILSLPLWPAPDQLNGLLQRLNHQLSNEDRHWQALSDQQAPCNRAQSDKENTSPLHKNLVLPIQCIHRIAASVPCIQ